MTTEQWAWVPGHEGAYQISSHGRVRSVPRIVMRRNGVPMTVRGRFLAPSRRPSGVATVTLADHGHYTGFYVHKLVRDVFGNEVTAA
jgi:hypothetical protein